MKYQLYQKQVDIVLFRANIYNRSPNIKIVGEDIKNYDRVIIIQSNEFKALY